MSFGRNSVSRGDRSMSTTEMLQADPLAQPTAYRVAQLNREDRLFHIILAQQFDSEIIETLCRLAEMIRNIADTKRGMSGSHSRSSS